MGAQNRKCIRLDMFLAALRLSLSLHQTATSNQFLPFQLFCPIHRPLLLSLSTP
jgi:hypothetical protein